MSVAVNDGASAGASTPAADADAADFDDFDCVVVSNARPIEPRCVQILMEADVSFSDGIGLTVTRRHPSSAGRTPIKNLGMIQAGDAVHGCENVPPPPGANGGCVHDSIVMVAFCLIMLNHELLPSLVNVS